MPVIKNDIVTLKNAAPATRTTPTFNIPTDVYGITLGLSRDNWPTIPDDGDLIVASLEYSNDNGQSWAPRGGFTATGGALPDDPESWIYIPVEDIGSNRRRIRATVTNTATFYSTVSITTHS
jgi:hypothetical protein